MGAYDELDKFQTEEGRKIVSDFVAKALADEQQPADVVTAEQQQDGAVEDVTAFLDAWEADRGFGNAIRGGNGDMPYLFATDLRAVLAERTALAARVAELESEREADTRAVTRVLRVYGTADGEPAAMASLRTRFADRIEALDATETEES